MKESKGVYVTKRTIKQDFQRACGYENKMRVKQILASCEVQRFATATHEIGCQVDVKKDLGCTCRLAGTRHLNERYFNAAEQIYTYHGLRSFTTTGVGSIRALQRKKVRKIYLPETVDRGVGDTNWSSSFFRKTNCTCGSNSGAKETSSKCVGGFPDLSSAVVNVKLSPIVKCNCVETGSEMPRSSEEKNIEISTQSTYTEDKKYIATTTQVQMTPAVADAPVDPISIPNAAKEVKDMSKVASKSRQRNKSLAAKAKAREEEKFSSDSLVQHIHDLECPSKMSRPSDDPVMENKIEREYRQIFATKSKSNQDQPSQDNRNTSLLRRRFEALRRGRKKEEPRNTVDLVSSSPTSLASHKDVSIASDPPSLEARSYSRPTAPYKAVASPTYDRTSYRRSVTGKKDRDSVPSMEDDSELTQGVSGMFRLWGKKFNLDDQKKTVKTDDNSKTEESMDYITGDTELPPTESKEVEKKAGGRKFSFFNKRSKDKTKSSYKSKKGMTTNRCEVKNGLMLKMAGTSNPQGNGVAETKKQPVAISTEKYDETLRKAWLKKFLSSTIDSRDSVKIRWNNAGYTTSSSTVFELMDNVYKHTGIVIRSKSDITTHKTKKSNNKKVNFIHQNIEAWMIPKTIPDRPMLIPTKMKSTPDKGDTKSIEVSLPVQKWSIDTAKTFSRKIELVLHSNNVVQLTNKVSSDFLRIDIPKGFFSDSTTGDEQDHQCRTSDEEVYKIVEYETLKSNSDFRKKGNFDTGDYASNEITVTVKVKDSQNVESKVLETVIKRPSMQRDVVTQGSDVYFPKRCDVIGVGIITQRDVREMKPILNMEDNLSEDESDPMTYSPKKNCEFAQSYLQDYYRHLMPQGVDLFSWCIDDSNVRICCSEKNSAMTLNHGDESKSCPNIYEELNAAATETAFEVATEVSSEMTLSSHGGTNFDEEIKNKSKIFYGTLCKEKRPKEQCAAVDKDTCEEKCQLTSKTDEHKRVLPKDSVEVFKKRKIYAVSQKRSKWGSSSNSQGGSLPSIYCRKPCCKSASKKQKSNSKHVIVTQPCPSPPEPCHSPPREVSCREEPPFPPCEAPCPPREPPCPHREPPCLSNVQPALKKPSSHDSKPTCRISKITINTKAFEFDKTIKLKCNKPAFPILPCTSPPSLCATVTPVSPSDADTTYSSNKLSKNNLILRRCHTPPPPNVDPKMRSISPLTSLLNCQQDICFPKVNNKKRLCSMICCKKSPNRKPLPTPKATENKKSGSFDCMYCMTPPCTEETETNTSSENEGWPHTAPTIPVVSSCHCCPISPLADLCQNDTPPPRARSSYQSNAPGSYPCANQPKLCPVPKISCPNANLPPSSPPCLPGGSPKQIFTPPSFPLIRQFAANRLASQSSLTSYHLSTNRIASYPPFSTDRSVEKQSSSPCSLPANHQCTANKPPSCSPTPPPDRSVSPPSNLSNDLNFLPPKCQIAVNQLASRRSILSPDRTASPPSSSSRCPFLKQQSTPPSSPPNLQCTQQSPCPKHDESISYISLIRKSLFPNSVPPEKQTIPKAPCKECCSPGVKSSNQTDTAAEYPPLIQSSSACIGISKCCSQSADTDTNRSTPVFVSSSSKHDCPCTLTPLLSSPKASQKLKSKFTGLFLKKLPSLKKTKAQSCCDDGKQYNIKVNDHCCGSRSGIREMKIQDEDGLTLCERTEYKTRSRTIHRPSVVGNVFETANICHRVSTNTSELKVNSNSKQCILSDDSSPSLANLVEIQFKMKVTQGDKITDINVGSGGNSEKDKVTKVKPNVYVVNKASEPVIVSNSPGNDIDIRIIIKNFKTKNKKVITKIKKESVIDEFTRKISQKFHTVSTGYSDIMHTDADQTGEPSNAFSVHRATWDLTCQSDEKEKAGKISRELSDLTCQSDDKEKAGKISREISDLTCQSDDKKKAGKISREISDLTCQSDDKKKAGKISREISDLTCHSDDKEKAGKISRDLSDYIDNEATNTNTNISLSAITLTESVIKYDEIPEKPVVQEKSYISVNLSVIKSDISKHEEREPNFVTDDTDQSTGVEIGIISSSDTARREKSPKAEKKKMLKMVIEKAGRMKHKNKDKVSKITRMLKTILTSDSSDHVDMTVIKNDLAKDITYASLPPNVLRDTDSMNNFFKISSMISDNEDKCDRLNTSRDTVTSLADDPPVAKTCGGEGGACLCNKVATKLGLSNGGCCCCKSKQPQKADIETNCDMRTDEDMFLLNYGTSSFIDQETQRSRLFCSKANSVNVTFFKSVLSNELDIFNVSEIKQFSSNNLEKSSQEEKKMIKKGSTPEALDNVLNLSDEDQIIIANMEPTKYKIETVYTEVRHRKEPKEKVRLNNFAPADILQSYETKKAVLEMYTERTLSKDGERLVAKLPKFSLEKESDIIKYEKICTRSLIFSLKR